MTVAYAVFIILILVCASIGIYMLTGKGVGMINLPATVKAKWDERRLCRTVGALLLFLTVCFLIMIAGLYFRVKLLEVAGLIMLFAGTARGVVRLMNPPKRQQLNVLR